jgi:DNA replication and repair protein RecF
MRVERLQLRDFRLFGEAGLELGAGGNVFTGGNGAGKTSLLESLHLLAYGRSFRGAVRDGLIRRGASALQVFAELHRADRGVRRLGLERGAREWVARIDGQPLAGLSDFYREIAVVCFEPGSHELIGGGSEHRRRYLDWFLFHVEPEFLHYWRRYQRALRQRNALLKQAAGSEPAQLEVWERELAEAGEALTVLRRRQLTRLEQEIATVAAHLLPELGAAHVTFHAGWSGDLSLSEALRLQRPRDLGLGHTSLGPHRADWTLGYAELPARELFSRGQEKLTALACLLAQAHSLAAIRGEWPILCLDDLASELDRNHLHAALDWIRATPAQWCLTGTELPSPLDPLPPGGRLFHVEQGQIARLL